MKKLCLSLILAAGALPSFAGGIGVSIGIGQPGVYGQINIGHVGPPVVAAYPAYPPVYPVAYPPVYTAPVIVPPPAPVVVQPYYAPPPRPGYWARHAVPYGFYGRPPVVYGPAHGRRPPLPPQVAWRGGPGPR